MTFIEALLYGAVQGVTEYLPISSSAHLILLPRFLGTEDPGLAFDVFLHVGTLLATLAYFWRDWWSILDRAIGRTPPPGARAGEPAFEGEATVSWKEIAVATLPALIAGAALHKWVETVFRGNAVLVVTLPLGGLALFLFDHYCKRSRHLDQMKLKPALAIGLIQCIALIPGISRSGSTITGARALGFDRSAAARFSFLISAPVTAAAIVFELRKYDQLLNGPVGAGALVVALVSSFVFGLLAIGGLMKLVKRFGYLSFAVYRVALAVVIWQVLGI